jgi:hypothetical protein
MAVFFVARPRFKLAIMLLVLLVPTSQVIYYTRKISP